MPAPWFALQEEVEAARRRSSLAGRGVPNLLVLTPTTGESRLTEMLSRSGEDGESPAFLFKAVMERNLARPVPELFTAPWECVGVQPLCIAESRRLSPSLPGRDNGETTVFSISAKCWCRLRDSNTRPPHYECGALPAELRRPGLGARKIGKTGRHCNKSISPAESPVLRRCPRRAAGSL